jgi:hypothetical protein
MVAVSTLYRAAIGYLADGTTRGLSGGLFSEEPVGKSKDRTDSMACASYARVS